MDSTTLGRFSTVEPNEFGTEINRLWQAAEQIKNVVVAQVENDVIPPMTGLNVISCITGQVFAYQAAHGQPSLAEIYTLAGNGQQLTGSSSRR